MEPVSIRPLTRDDIPRIAALRGRVFERSEQASRAALEEHLDRVFLRNPWRDDAMPSWVYEDERKGIVGFIGVVPRRMAFRGRPIRVAVGTQLMVDPEHRGLAGIQLLSRLLRGPQDFTLSDSANDIARRLWERLGGSTALLYSLAWTRAIRPLRFATTQLGEGGASRVGMRAVRPLASAADALATRLSGSYYRAARPAGQTTPLNVETAVRLLPAMAGGYALGPAYDEETLRWLLERAEARTGLGRLQCVLVRDGEGVEVGWCVYYQYRRGVGQVAQIAALPGREGEVLDHLFRHARAAGVMALSGRAEPWLMAPLSERRACFRREGPWCLVHSRDPELLAAVHRGDSFLSRLDGEWWMGF